MKRFFAVLAMLAMGVMSANVHAAEGYKPEGKDTRPVKVDQQPVDPHAGHVHTKGDGHDHGTDANGKEDDPSIEKPAPDLTSVKLDFSILETIAIQDGGRNKPLNTYITEKMELIAGRSVVSGVVLKERISGQTINATDLFLSLWLRRKDMVEVPLVLVAYGPLREKLGLPKDQKHFSLVRLGAGTKLMEIGQVVHQKRLDGNDRDLTDMEKEAEIVLKRMNTAREIVEGDQRLMIVPHPNKAEGDWVSLFGLTETFGELKQSPYNQAKSDALIRKFIEFQEAYRARNAADFARTAQEFRSELAGMSSFYPPLNELNREITFNKSRPFFYAWMLYFVAAVVGFFAIRKPTTSIPYRIMMLTMVAGLAWHIYGFVLRCLIAGRPPVSNMYESVIWVGFGAVFFGLIFELIYRKAYYALSGAGAGFFCLVLMDTIPIFNGNSQMPGFENTINPLVPVLRDNFWLTIHVLTITLSYAAFMLGWVLSHVTLGHMALWPRDKNPLHELHQFIYRVVQIGVLLLAIGTILGGVWAYYSWGRFWGWDPKETWAFIALFCYLFVLHGRFAGWWGNVGLSFGSVLCFQAVVFAWWGVNFFLGSLGNGGLHSYGAGAGGEEWVFGAIGVDLFATGFVAFRYFTGRNAVDEDKLTNTDPITEARTKELDEPAPSAGE
jgi:ABC-type transport system involved in cytochrome c biogenesis permease subunit